MLLAILFFDDETGDIGTVNARLSIAALNGESVSAVLTVQTNGAVFAVDHYSRAVFAVDSDGAVFAVSTFLPEHQIVIYIDFVRIGNSAFAFDGGILTIFQNRLSCRHSIFQLAEVDCVTVHRAVSHVGDLLIVCIETVFVDIGLSVNGQTVIIDHRAACCDTVHFHIFSQFHIQRAVSGYYADIPV